MTAAVVVLNADWTPIQAVDLRHAVRMLLREVAVVHEAVEGETYGPFPKPKILRLVKYVYVKFKSAGAPRYSRMNILRRDRHSCAYCAKHADTIDHLLPRSKGGKSSWLNAVAACRRCNEKKANKTPQEAGMKLLFEPFTPTFFQLER